MIEITLQLEQYTAVVSIDLNSYFDDIKLDSFSDLFCYDLMVGLVLLHYHETVSNYVNERIIRGL